MADVPVGAVPGPEAKPLVAPSVAGKADAARVARAAKLAAVTKGLESIPADGSAPADPKVEAKVETAKVETVDPKIEGEKPVEKPAEKPVEAKPSEKKPDESDTETQKRLALVDKRMAEFRDEQRKAKADFDAERAEFRRQQAEWQAKASSIDDLKKLADLDPIAALEKLGVKPDDESRWEHVGRGAFTRTKAGKADPNARKEVAQTARERELALQLEELKKGYDELRNEFQTRDQKAESKAFVERYLDEAVKTIPQTPTLIGKLHTKSPQKARQALYQLGAEMESTAMREAGDTKYDPSYTPSHAAVIAEYEKRRRAELEEQGVDVDALLAVAPAQAAKPAPKTLDITAPRGTNPINPKPSREEKLKTAARGLSALE